MSSPSSESTEPFWRTFVAIEINDDARRNLREFQTALQRCHAHVAWVPPENVHLSLVFLGDVPAEKVELLAAALDGAAGAVLPFDFAVAGAGYFGGPRSPRVIWAGVEPCAPLLTLQARVESALRDLGLPLGTRAYQPHLTLGRVRSSRGCDALVKLLDAAAGRQFGRVTAADVVLFRSRLQPQGAIYSVLHRSILCLP